MSICIATRSRFSGSLNEEQGADWVAKIDENWIAYIRLKFADNILAGGNRNIFNSGLWNWVRMMNFHGDENSCANRLADFIAGISEFNIAFAILSGYDRYDFDA